MDKSQYLSKHHTVTKINLWSKNSGCSKKVSLTVSSMIRKVKIIIWIHVFQDTIPPQAAYLLPLCHLNYQVLVVARSEAPSRGKEAFCWRGFESHCWQNSFCPFFGQTPVDAGHQAMFFELRRPSPYCR